MKLNKLSASAFAEKVGVQPSSISHILSERNKPSLEFILKILTHFPNVSADWLITGNTKVSEKQEFQKEIETKKLPPTPLATKKQIKKIVIFYTDNSFEEFNKG